MKKVFIVLGVLFALISVIFTVLPLGTLAIIPIVPALFFGFLGFRNSYGKQMYISRLAILVAGLMLVIVIGKELLIKDEVIADEQFEQTKADSEKETVKELEEIEGLE